MLFISILFGSILFYFMNTLNLNYGKIELFCGTLGVRMKKVRLNNILLKIVGKLFIDTLFGIFIIRELKNS